MRHSSPSIARIALIAVLTLCAGESTRLFGQTETKEPAKETTEAETPAEQPAAKIDVKPAALDTDIATRLTKILQATEWFEDPRVVVTEGVVFLEGTTNSNERKEWATKLASNTESVVAVANRMTVRESSIWDFSPAWREIDTMRRNAIQALPQFLLSLLILIATYFAAKLFALLWRRIAARRTENPLLRDVLVKALTIPVTLFGIYLALRVTGLTRLAATVLGGTGLLGLILGIAFRDIAENFLASLLISMQRPFRAGDDITVEGRSGIVLAVTTRGTTLMTPEGNHVRIPNSIIYKSAIINKTANPKQRVEYFLSLDAQQSLSHSQEAVLKVLKEHEAVLKDPEPLVLIDRMYRNIAILKVLFWLDTKKHAKDKVRSALIRLSKIALREVSKECKTPVTAEANHEQTEPAIEEPDESSSTRAEGRLESDADEIQRQAMNSRSVEEGTDLLSNSKEPKTPART
jgi:small conductance mechanosensitive channel